MKIGDCIERIGEVAWVCACAVGLVALVIPVNVVRGVVDAVIAAWTITD